MRQRHAVDSEADAGGWFRIDGPVAELYDLGVVPGVVRPMALGLASNEVLGLITHDQLAEDLQAAGETES